MKYLDLIFKTYNGNIKSYEPIKKSICNLPKELYDLLSESNGVEETDIIDIGWIVYPYKMIIEETEFFKNEYSINGFVFSDDGAGNPYYIKQDGKIYYYDCGYNEEVYKNDSLYDFFQK